MRAAGPPSEPRPFVSLLEALATVLLLLVPVSFLVFGLQAAYGTSRLTFELAPDAPAELALPRLPPVGEPQTRTPEVRLERADDVVRLVVPEVPAPDVDPVTDRVRAWAREAGTEVTDRSIATDTDLEALVLRHGTRMFALQAGILLVYGAVVIRLRVRGAPRERRSRLPVAILLGCAAGCVAFFCTAIVGVVQTLLGVSVEEQAWVLELLGDRGALIRLLPWLVVVVPAAEEVLFRGYLFRFLLQRSWTAAAYLVSAGLFSLAHWNPSGVALYFVVGLVFAAVCHWTSRLSAAVAAHVTYNGIVILLGMLRTAVS